jgi:hypothetical protein
MTTTPHRIRASLGGLDKAKIDEVTTRAQAIYNGLDSDKVTYAGANPTVPAFLVLIQNVTTAQLVVPTRAIGAAATRDVARGVCA